MPTIQIANGYPQPLRQEVFLLSFPGISDSDEVLLNLGGKILELRFGGHDAAYSTFLEVDSDPSRTVMMNLADVPLEVRSLDFAVRPWVNGSQSWILTDYNDESSIWVNQGARTFSGIPTTLARFTRNGDFWSIEALEETVAKATNIPPIPVVPEPAVLVTNEVNSTSAVLVTEPQDVPLETSETYVTSAPNVALNTPVYGLPEHLKEDGQVARSLGQAGEARNFELIFDVSASMHDNLRDPEGLLPVVYAIQALSASVSPKPITISMGVQSERQVLQTDDVLALLTEEANKALGIEIQSSDALEDLLEDRIAELEPNTAVFVVSDAFPYLEPDDLIPLLESGKKQMRILLLDSPAFKVEIGDSKRLQWQQIDTKAASSVLAQITKLI